MVRLDKILKSFVRFDAGVFVVSNKSVLTIIAIAHQIFRAAMPNTKKFEFVDFAGKNGVAWFAVEDDFFYGCSI